MQALASESNMTTRKKAAKKVSSGNTSSREARADRAGADEITGVGVLPDETTLIMNVSKHNIFTDQGKLTPGRVGYCSLGVAAAFLKSEIAIEVAEETDADFQS